MRYVMAIFFLVVGLAAARWPAGRALQMWAVIGAGAPINPTASDYPGLVGWWDASVASSILRDGDGVTNWLDQSGLGRTAYQTEANSRPWYETNSINGKIAVSFGLRGARIGQLILPTIQTAPGSNYTVLVVMRVTGTQPSNRGLIIGSLTSGYAAGNQFAAYSDGGDFKMRTSYRDVLSALPAANGSGLLSTSYISVVSTRLKASDGTLVVHVDGILSGSATNATSRPKYDASTDSSWRIGYAATTVNTYYEGQIHELAYYTNALADAQIEALSQSLALKWGL